MKNEELTKSLVSLIDETLEELEELKKSKFTAAEIKIEGPGDKDVAGKPTNGELDAKKAEDEDEEDDEKKVEKGVLDEAEKSEKDEKDEEDEDKKKDKKIAQKEIDKHNEKKHGEKEDEDSAYKSMPEEDSLKKSLEEQEELIKSYVDSKFASFEEKIAGLIKKIDEIGDAPVERKGVSAENFSALKKSEEEVAPLSKAQVADKLFELKKSGNIVDTEDIIRVETGSNADLMSIAEKYKL